MNTKPERKKKEAANGQWITFLIYMLIGAACGLLIMSYMNQAERSGMSGISLLLTFVLLFLSMYAAFLIQIIIHEAGHLLFGLLTGYQFSSFRIASFMWLKDGQRIRFSRMTLAGTGGQCLMVPPDMKNGKMPVMLYNYGGAILNAASSVISLVCAFLCPAWSVGFMIVMFFAVSGIAYALTNGLPVRMGEVNNDGRNALDLAKSPEAVRAFWIQMKVNELISRGIRIKDMPEEWFTVPSDESMRNGIIAPLGTLACNRLMDQHRFREADALMERLLSQESGMVGLYRSLLVCDRMYVELISANRREVLDGMRSKGQMKIMKTMKASPAVLRTEYTYALLAERDAGKADAIRKQFEKCACSYPYQSEVQAERELIDIADSKRI